MRKQIDSNNSGPHSFWKSSLPNSLSRYQKITIGILIACAVIWVGMTDPFKASVSNIQTTPLNTAPLNTAPLNAATIAQSDNNSCLLTSSQLKTWVKNSSIDEVQSPDAGLSTVTTTVKAVTVIDTRPAKEFAETSIAHSLNLKPYALKSKEYLKPKKILLVGSAHAIRDLEETCQSMRTYGFENVRVLVGGLETWYAAGLPIQGSTSVFYQKRVISPQDFVRETSYRPWLIVNSDESNKLDAMPICNGEIIKVPFGENPAKFIEELKEQLLPKLEKNEALMAGIFLSKSVSDADSQALLQLLSSNKLPRTFIIDGGASALNVYLTQQTKMLKDKPVSDPDLVVHQCRALPVK